jgi:anti-sigma regulatory factor (Ser/Thr protein kinase)
MIEPEHCALGELKVELPCCPAEIDQFCLRVRSWLAEHCWQSTFASELLLRESLANAIGHGHGIHAKHKIKCVIRASNSRVLIHVADDGPGFDWRTEIRRLATLAEMSGRGMELYRTYATQIRFSGNGNTITLIRRFGT